MDYIEIANKVAHRMGFRSRTQYEQHQLKRAVLRDARRLGLVPAPARKAECKPNVGDR